ncbi:phosphatase 2C-domain-containing protein [Myxozyma melibiosi]|uniref:protein-serine/threonine phosphatase n=1 Tax=Myxozyma melibiosi TaxID=54550 RepID=A0ABR1F027_9ASCO
MGQLLSEPIVDKASEKGCDEHWLIYGTSSMQGWRISMEDAHTAVLDLKREDGKLSPDKKISFFAVYDGHGGSKAAIFAGQHLHNIVARQAAFEKGDYEQALKDGFLSTDRAILQDVSFGNDPSGCTATTALVTDSKIFVANAGDSRTVLGVKGHAKPLSYDHKPQNEGEKARIVAAGGFVDGGRVNGNLALSRAIGDFDFKKSPELPPEEQVVTAFPDVIEHDISPDDEFIVLACDGIWDCLTSQQVVEFVRRGIAEKQDLQLICENLMDNCLASSSDGAGIGCDNMTVTIVGLLNGMTSEEWYDLVATRVANGEGAVGDPELGKSRL